MAGTPWKSVTKREHPFGKTGVNASLDAVAKYAAEGANHPNVKTWSTEMLDVAREKGLSRANTPRERASILLSAVQKKLWIPDPTGTEYMMAAHLLACDPRNSPDKVCVRGGDCFAEGTLVLTDNYELVAIENLKAGTKIWGLDRWSEVQAVQFKGVLACDVITLNNGAELKLTPDHHVYVLDCPKHPERAKPCSCPPSERTERRIRVSELEEGMVMPQPERIPFGLEAMDPDRALIEGFYISDGWTDVHDAKPQYRFSISGQDGCPKEAQKRVVQEICQRLQIETNWHRKYIRVKDPEWALRMAQMGQYAWQKRVLSLNLDESSAANTLRGIMADSGKNTRGSERTFTTTSHTLFVQTRVLHRMFGVACGSRYIEDHGGLGRNPIWRLGTRDSSGTNLHEPWLLRVKSIDREVFEAPCWDITTDDHRVYLPEHDVTVSQCDDLAILLAAAWLSVGLHVLIVGHAYDDEHNIEHVLCACWLDGRWVYGDPSTDYPLGKNVPCTWERVLSVPNVKVVCDDDVCIGQGGGRVIDPERLNFVEKGVFIGVDGFRGLKTKIVWVSGDRTLARALRLARCPA